MDDQFNNNGNIDLSKDNAQPQQDIVNQNVQQNMLQQNMVHQNVQQDAFNQNAYNQNMQQGSNAAPPVYNINNINIVQEKSTKAGIALALAIIGLLTGCCGMGGLFVILAVIFGILSLKNKEPKSGMAIAALVISAIALIVNIVAVCAVFIPAMVGYIEASEQAASSTYTYY